MLCHSVNLLCAVSKIAKNMLHFFFFFTFLCYFLVLVGLSWGFGANITIDVSVAEENRTWLTQINFRQLHYSALFRMVLFISFQDHVDISG